MIPSFQFFKEISYGDILWKSGLSFRTKLGTAFCLSSVPAVADEYKRVGEKKKKNPENRKNLEHL